MATASNEPDYGLDLGLYTDNATAYGQRMGLGRQPYGNPALAYGSQAPFHMAFHHESRLMYLAVGDLRRTMTDSRIALFSALARHAFFVFTLLDAAVFPEHPLLVGHDIDDVAAFCRKLAPWVEVVRGYV